MNIIAHLNDLNKLINISLFFEIAINFLTIGSNLLQKFIFSHIFNYFSEIFIFEVLTYFDYKIKTHKK
jgi:hypothetical protein